MISYSFKNTYFLLVFLFFFSLISCGQSKSSKLQVQEVSVLEILPGAQQTNLYLKLLASKNVAVVANQTSVIFKSEKIKNKKDYRIENINYTHVVDSLLSLKINVSKVFSPEHGFRGDADAGEKVIDGLDAKTGIPIVSLYGSNKKPSKEQLKGIDVVVFDIQDVGVRFYTYISTLHYVMEACAEQGITVIVLDRPNPNGQYIDGPTLEMEHTSFVGMHPIPVVYGMTIGEYAQMINGEHWLQNNIKCDLTVIPLKNYNHSNSYSLPIKPSPNLPNDKAINLYPSLCFFEGTNVSVGRGTEKQFQIFGSPFMKPATLNFCFTPQPNNGAKHPMHENIECCGFDLSNIENLSKIELSYLIEAYSLTKDKSKFFNNFFTRLAGTTKLQEQLENNTSTEEIYASWKPKIEKFKKIRLKYVLYE
ncbi:exo-beta-N-acetylmuramidase NamZ domain-containing protein [Lutibacter sp.]|uniref:exo-beta-N-acetylmuramidase NamZ family protein n=1 Tax=Lutibacter sp. TaxID=1925666 RepID=UPI003561BD01